MNEWNGIGRITHDLELKEVGDGLKVVNFQLAVDDRFDPDHTDFLRCVAWNRTAEVMAQYLGKGSLVSITGRIKTGRYEDEDGKTVYTTDIIVRNLGMIESKNMRERREQRENANNDQFGGYDNQFGGQSHAPTPPPAPSPQPNEPSIPDLNDELPELDITSDDLPF